MKHQTRTPAVQRLEKFQKKIRGRLKDWKEEEHRADAELSKITKHERIAFKPSGQGKAFRD